MDKKAFYFSHDFNARNDEKIIQLRMKHGMLGYGVYFAILERLGEATDYVGVVDYNVIAYDLRADASVVKSVIRDFGLFSFTGDGECFYSESLINRMKPLDELKSKRSDAGKAGMKKRWKSEQSKKTDNTVITLLQETDNNTVTKDGNFITDKGEVIEENKEKPANAGKKKAGEDPPKEKTWRDSFDIYLQELRKAYTACIGDRKWLDERQRYHPRLDIPLTLEKACKDYWAKEAGWKKKKASKTASIDWIRTFNNALTVDCNRVWKTKEQIENETNGQKKIIYV
jgi:hypothetical protein